MFCRDRRCGTFGSGTSYHSQATAGTKVPLLTPQKKNDEKEERGDYRAGPDCDRVQTVRVRM